MVSSVPINAVVDDSTDYAINAIVLGNRVENVGLTLTRGKWYASSGDVGNVQKYFEIQIESFVFKANRSDENFMYPTIDIISKSIKVSSSWVYDFSSAKRIITRSIEMNTKLKSFLPYSVWIRGTSWRHMCAR